VTDRSEAMESRRETVGDDGGDGDGDADPIRLRGAQREIRDAYFASDSGLFTLDCVPGPANRSSPTTSPPRTSSAGTRPGTRRRNNTSRSSRLTATRRPTSSRRSAIGCRRSSNTTSSPPRSTSLRRSYDISDSACDRPPYAGTIDGLLREIFREFARDAGFDEMPSVGNDARS